MADNYTYPLDQCDIPRERYGALQSYRDKRRKWLSWIDTDKDHAIWLTLSSLVWRDASFRSLNHFANSNQSNCLNNVLLGEAVSDGYVTMQILGIRRLMDNSNSDVVSLRKLIKDIRRNFQLFTRENFVCFDGLPYDYAAVEQREMSRRGPGFFWFETSGPNGWGTSERAHQQFDRLTGIAPDKRTREDRLPLSLVTTIDSWLDDTNSDELVSWSDNYLAHAGGPTSRARMGEVTVTANKISDVIRILARVTEAVSAHLLFASSRTNSLMPVAQFNPFEKLDVAAVRSGEEEDAHKLWDRLTGERDQYLEGVETDLIKSG